MFFIIPVKTILIKLFGMKAKRSDENLYEKNVKKFDHYDLLNPITRALGISRLQGTTLSDSIRKCILK